jgi:hypothetical protein
MVAGSTLGSRARTAKVRRVKDAAAKACDRPWHRVRQRVKVGRIAPRTMNGAGNVEVRKEYVAGYPAGGLPGRSPISTAALPMAKNRAAEASRIPSPVATESPRGVRGPPLSSSEDDGALAGKGVPQPPQTTEVSSLSFPQYSQRFILRSASRLTTCVSGGDQPPLTSEL